MVILLNTSWRTTLIHTHFWFCISDLVRFPWWLRHVAREPVEGNPLWETWNERTSEFTHFNLVIRLSKVKQLALYRVSLQRPSD